MIFIEILIFLAIAAVNYQLYQAFYVPEMARRKAFKKLSDEQLAELRDTMTAEHFFKLQADVNRSFFKPKILRGK